jgi:hypothetical protein
MAVATLRNKEMKRFDTMLTLPLAQFRRALTRLTTEELAALEQRIARNTIRGRWQRGGYGIERHRSRHELALLARRRTEVQRALQSRRASIAAPISLSHYAATVQQPARAEAEERAA